MAFIHREIEPLLKRSLEQFSAVVLTGARQAGKSTLVRHLFPQFNYVSLDELDTRNYAIDDPRGFLKSYPCPLIIDEIQEAPSLLTYIKKIIDDNRSQPGLFIITGSQQFSLMEGVQETLAGRAAVLDLHTLSLFELNSKQSWEQLVHQGSYPELLIKKSIDRNLWYSSYIKTFLERDIKSHLQKDYLKHYEQFLNLIISRCAQELNYADIAKDLGVDEKTIKSWVSFLERSQIIFLLPPYPKKIDNKQISKKPKIYFYDTGLIAYRLGYLSPKQILNGPLAGSMFENLVISEIVKRMKANSQAGFLYHYRDKSGLEVDLILETQSYLKIIEIKKNETPTISLAQNLLKFSALVDNVESMYLVSPHQQEFVQREVHFSFYRDLYELFSFVK